MKSESGFMIYQVHLIGGSSKIGWVVSFSGD